MKKKYSKTIGFLEYNEEKNFFFGNVNGNRVKMNSWTDKDGKTKWILSEEFELFEYDQQPTQDKSPGRF
jgi:hypothetical protein